MNTTSDMTSDTTSGSERKGKPSVGFIGMGRMGSAMARRLLDAGYPLTVYDRTPERSEQIGQRGAAVTATPAALAARCDVVMVCVTDDTAQQQVTLGQDGALAGVRKGAVIIDLSTVSPGASRRLHEAAARAKGVAMVDAAVSGSVPQVERGGLVIFVGGEPETYERCRPLLQVLG